MDIRCSEPCKIEQSLLCCALDDTPVPGQVTKGTMPVVPSP